VAQDRNKWMALVNTIINLRFPYNFGKFFGGGATGGFSRRTQLHEVNWLCEV
jgi:hypothetical protein